MAAFMTTALWNHFFCARPRLRLFLKGIARTPGLNTHRGENIAGADAAVKLYLSLREDSRRGRFGDFGKSFVPDGKHATCLVVRSIHPCYDKSQPYVQKNDFTDLRLTCVARQS